MRRPRGKEMYILREQYAAQFRYKKIPTISAQRYAVVTHTLSSQGEVKKKKEKKKQFRI